MKLPKAHNFKDRNEFRKWLTKNHDKAEETWLLYYKKHTGKPSVTHEEAVEEALCFGWIDSMVRRIDDERYMQKYTPRKPKSVWSEINKKAALNMINKKKMTKAGLKKIDEAKKNGKWQAAYTSKRKERIPSYLKNALMKNKKAWKNFQNFANTYQNMYIGWVKEAKREETKERRIKEVVKRSVKNIKAG